MGKRMKAVMRNHGANAIEMLAHEKYNAGTRLQDPKV
jgi:hypothetical protein